MSKLINPVHPHLDGTVVRGRLHTRGLRTPITVSVSEEELQLIERAVAHTGRQQNTILHRSAWCRDQLCLVARRILESD